MATIEDLKMNKESESRLERKQFMFTAFFD